MKVCVIGGGAIYRLPIYNNMAKELNCDFYISCDETKFGIATYNFNDLMNCKAVLPPPVFCGNFHWTRGLIGLFFKPYDMYVVGGPYSLASWVMIFLSLFSKKKIASWSHGLYGREKGVRRVFKIWYYKLCSLNFVYNTRSARLMEAAGINPTKIVSVGNAMDTEKELRIRKELTEDSRYRDLFKNDYPVVIFVGRVIEDKRLDQVIESLRILKDKGTKVNFFVIGKDVDGVNLAERAKNAGIEDQVYLYGPCYDEEIVARFFYNADVCVSPGAIGLTATNAMTYGCPAISHDNFNYQGPEYEAIIPGETGDFFKENDVADLAIKIEKWTKIAPVEREQIRKNCFAEVDRFWNIYSETNAFKKALS